MERPAQSWSQLAGQRLPLPRMAMSSTITVPGTTRGCVPCSNTDYSARRYVRLQNYSSWQL